jgi:hypothetical protein
VPQVDGFCPPLHHVREGDSDVVTSRSRVVMDVYSIVHKVILLVKGKVCLEVVLICLLIMCKCLLF